MRQPFLVQNHTTATDRGPLLESCSNDSAPAETIFLDAQFESELYELAQAEAAETLEDAGCTESGLGKLACVGFDTLGLAPYLTGDVVDFGFALQRLGRIV